MRSKSFPLLFSLSLLALQACSNHNASNTLQDGSIPNPGNPIAYQEGNNYCSSAFVLYFNSVANSIAGMNPINPDLNKIQNMVNDFSAKYAGVICLAGDKNDAPSAIEVNTRVAEWNQLLMNIKGEDTVKVAHIEYFNTLSAKNTSEVSKPVSLDYSNNKKFILEALDIEKLNSFLNLDDPLADFRIQNGKIHDAVTEPEKNDYESISCRFSKNTQETQDFRMNQKYVYKFFQDPGRYIDGNAEDASIAELVCVKFSTEKAPITLDDLNRTFAGVARFTLKN